MADDKKPLTDATKVAESDTKVGVRVKEGITPPDQNPIVDAKVVKTSKKAKEEANAPGAEPFPDDTPPKELDISNPAHGNLTYSELQEGKENDVDEVKPVEVKPFTGEAKADYVDINDAKHANLTYDELQNLAAKKRK